VKFSEEFHKTEIFFSVFVVWLLSINIMLWLIKESIYLLYGFGTILVDLSIDSINPFSSKQPSLNDLNDPTLLSSLLNCGNILSIEDGETNGNDKLEAGGGGNGTCRKSLIVKLENGKILYCFVKVPTTSLVERVFLTLFKVYNNELHFYKELRNEWMERLELTKNDWKPFPDVYCVK
jgi:hypothetical protein